MYGEKNLFHPDSDLLHQLLVSGCRQDSNAFLVGMGMHLSGQGLSLEKPAVPMEWQSRGTRKTHFGVSEFLVRHLGHRALARFVLHLPPELGPEESSRWPERPDIALHFDTLKHLFFLECLHIALYSHLISMM